MNIPTYIALQSVDENLFPTADQQAYDSLLNDTLQDGLSDDGWTLPQVTHTQVTNLASLMPDGTMWYVTDASPPQMVVKIDGSLRKVTTTAYP